MERQAGGCSFERRSRATSAPTRATTCLQAEKIFKWTKLDWPNAFLSRGWNSSCSRTFNLYGYGLVLVDAQGVVRAST